MYSVLVECSRIATQRRFCNIECFPDQANVRNDIEDTEEKLSAGRSIIKPIESVKQSIGRFFTQSGCQSIRLFAQLSR